MSRIVSLPALHDHAVAVLAAAGMSREHATWTADGLVWADAHDLPAHGVGTKLVQCVERIRAGGTSARPTLGVVADRPGHVLIDAHHAWGHVAGTDAMRRAISRAEELGVAAVSVRRTSSAAAMGYFADLAADRGCIGLAATNGPPLVAAPGGSRRVVGNQGHALAAPGEGGNRILYDTATTTMSTGQMDQYRERGEPLPEGVLRDADGRPTRDPSQWATGLLEPIGGHRGFGLSVALELLTGVLGGGDRFGDSVGLPTRHEETQGVSLFMLAIAPVPGESLTARVDALAGLIDGTGPDARAPGVRATERAERARVHGVQLEEATLERLARTAASVGVGPLRGRLPSSLG